MPLAPFMLRRGSLPLLYATRSGRCCCCMKRSSADRTSSGYTHCGERYREVSTCRMGPLASPTVSTWARNPSVGNIAVSWRFACVNTAYGLYLSCLDQVLLSVVACMLQPWLQHERGKYQSDGGAVTRCRSGNAQTCISKYPQHMSSSRSLALRAHDMCMCMCIRVRACMHRLRRSYICIASFYS